MAQKKRLEVLPLALTLLGAAVLCGLGTWQVQRLQWKQGLIAQTQLPPVSVSRASDLADGELHFRRTTLNGTYRQETEILVEPVIGTGHLYTAFSLADGTVIWVNRGTIKTSDYKDHPLKAPQSGQATGLLARSPQASVFKPPNNPQKREFFSANPDDMGQVYDLRAVQPYILYLETPDDSALTAFQPELRNNHLQYAIFWYVMAGLMGLIYWLRFHKNAASP